MPYFFHPKRDNHSLSLISIPDLTGCPLRVLPSLPPQRTNQSGVGLFWLTSRWMLDAAVPNARNLNVEVLPAFQAAPFGFF